MKTNHWVLVAGVVLLAASLSFTPAFTRHAKLSGSTAARSDGAKVKRSAGRRVPKVDPADGKLLSPYSLAERTALSKQDCLPNNLHKDGLGIHGHYRTYGQWDPQLKSIEGRKQYEACVKRGLDPTPGFAFGQRMMIGMTGDFFGQTKERCLMCHSKY